MPPKRAEWKDQHKQITTDAEYEACIAYKGLTVLEVHSGWCGPCECLVPTLKQLHWDLKEERQCGLEFVVSFENRTFFFGSFVKFEKRLIRSFSLKIRLFLERLTRVSILFFLLSVEFFSDRNFDSVVEEFVQTLLMTIALFAHEITFPTK